MFPAFFCAIAYRRAQDTLQKRRGFDVFWNTMYGPPQYSHVLNAVVSHTAGLACCRAYLLRHFCEQKMRRRPRPFPSGMAFPQFGQTPITLMLFASISSTMLSSHTNRVFPGSEISRNHDFTAIPEVPHGPIFKKACALRPEKRDFGIFDCQKVAILDAVFTGQ